MAQADQQGEDVDQVRRAQRKTIGQAIIDGLMNPVTFGPLEAYNQKTGGYWQGPGDTHTQGSGDYHQGVVVKG